MQPSVKLSLFLNFTAVQKYQYTPISRSGLNQMRIFKKSGKLAEDLKVLERNAF